MQCSDDHEIDDDDDAYVTAAAAAVMLNDRTSHDVVRTTSKVNGKCQISGSASSETLGSIFKKNCRVDYVGDPTPHTSFGVNQFKGGVSARNAEMKLSPSGVYFSFF